jgi:hypothetical protein
LGVAAANSARRSVIRSARGINVGRKIHPSAAVTPTLRAAEPLQRGDEPAVQLGRPAPPGLPLRLLLLVVASVVAALGAVAGDERDRSGSGTATGLSAAARVDPARDGRAVGGVDSWSWHGTECKRHECVFDVFARQWTGGAGTTLMKTPVLCVDFALESWSYLVRLVAAVAGGVVEAAAAGPELRGAHPAALVVRLRPPAVRLRLQLVLEPLDHCTTSTPKTNRGEVR